MTAIGQAIGSTSSANEFVMEAAMSEERGLSVA